MKNTVFKWGWIVSGLALGMTATLLVRANPAGVIPYACLVDEAYVLLAFDPVVGRRGYGAFGGGRDLGESIAETAAREMREETRCAFDTPTAADLATKTPSDSDGYFSFVAEVPYVSQLDIPEHACDAGVERSDWLWVRLSDLKKGLAADEARPEVLVSLMHKYITLWDGAADSLRQAVADGLLPDSLCAPSAADQ